MTGEPMYDLLAAIVRQAVKDAKRGNRHAARWLNEFMPEWRRYK